MYDVKYVFYLTFIRVLIKVKCPCLSSIKKSCAVTKIGINEGPVGGDERKSKIEE